MNRFPAIDDQRFTRLALLGLGLGFLLQLVVVTTALVTYARNKASSDRVEHAYQVLAMVSGINLTVERAETAARGYLLTRDPLRAELYRNFLSSLPLQLRQLQQAIGNSPAQRANLASLRSLLERELSDLGHSMALATAGRMDVAIATFRNNAAHNRLTDIRAAVARMSAEENRLMVQRKSAETRSGSALKLVLIGTALLMALVGLFTFLLARRYVSSLADARDRLFALNHDLEGAVQRRTFELVRANEEVQRFAYIVSHDLRSPLVNILGFTAELEATNTTLGGLIAAAEKEAPQLLTADVRNAQADLPEAIGFIRSSTKKMDRLINAILRLSREGRRTLVPELLPMDHILDEIAASLSQLAEKAGANVTIEKPLPDITNDRVAIEQIFSNLIENAVKYLDRSSGGQITVRGRSENGRAVFEIEDNGRGIDPRDHERIFELFRRSGPQDNQGEGIGLAQVRALVNRLGGFIDVESELGSGSTFRLNLPTTYIDLGGSNE